MNRHRPGGGTTPDCNTGLAIAGKIALRKWKVVSGGRHGMDAKVEHRRQDEADILVSRISDEIGRLSVDIADVVGDVQQVSALIDTQTDQFHAITQATREIADSNQSIARMAVETQRVAAPATQEAGKSPTTQKTNRK